MALACEVTPLSAFQSTNLSNKLESYQQLGDRIKRSLGYPLITLEIHQDQLFENIQIAIEFFTKFAGYTQEYLIFDSSLYEKNKGIRLDHLFTLANSPYRDATKIADAPPVPGLNYNVTSPDAVYVNTTPISYSQLSGSNSLSALFVNGIYAYEILDKSLYSSLTSFSPTFSANFNESYRRSLTNEAQTVEATTYSNAFDYDIMDYRKVIDCVEFEEGSSTGVNTLFTLEQTLAQQTYFSYALGNYGFDLLSWYSLKEFVDTREKMLATRRDIMFDPRTQYLTMYPQPNKNIFYGVISCYVERPLRDLVKEQWIYQYALALSKITIGYVRGKFTGIALLGGGTLNTSILEEGRSEKAELERRLLEGASPGFGDSDPIMFFVG